MESSIGRWLHAVLMATSGLHNPQPFPTPGALLLTSAGDRTSSCLALARRPQCATLHKGEYLILMEQWKEFLKKCGCVSCLFVCFIFIFIFLVCGIAIPFWLSRHQEKAVRVMVCVGVTAEGVKQAAIKPFQQLQNFP